MGCASSAGLDNARRKARFGAATSQALKESAGDRHQRCVLTKLAKSTDRGPITLESDEHRTCPGFFGVGRLLWRAVGATLIESTAQLRRDRSRVWETTRTAVASAAGRPAHMLPSMSAAPCILVTFRWVPCEAIDGEEGEPEDLGSSGKPFGCQAGWRSSLRTSSWPWSGPCRQPRAHAAASQPLPVRGKHVVDDREGRSPLCAV